MNQRLDDNDHLLYPAYSGPLYTTAEFVSYTRAQNWVHKWRLKSSLYSTSQIVLQEKVLHCSNLWQDLYWKLHRHYYIYSVSNFYKLDVTIFISQMQKLRLALDNTVSKWRSQIQSLVYGVHSSCFLHLKAMRPLVHKICLPGKRHCVCSGKPERY